ncbi:AMP-binding protein [Methylibium sp.]|uniref:AMP-binding protein n=1 Tax=Methylibium sp. TaxID=2067992 RepID=UPI00345C479C
MSAVLPMIAAFDPARVIAWRDGEPVGGARFLADAAAQAALLPARGAVLNLCGDRYRFAVGLAAALMRGQTSLLPPNALPDTLARLLGTEPALYGLTDDPALAVPGLPLQHVAQHGASSGGTARHALAADDAASEMRPALPRIAAEQAAVCLLTSGSTGVPQPHLKRWGTLVRNIEAAAERLAMLLERPSLVGLNIVATVPAQHSYGLESSVLLALLGGAAFDAGRPFYPADIVRSLERLPRPRALVTTPFHLKTLMAAGLRLPPTDLVLCATAPLSPQLALAAERAFGGPLIEIYGCTEAGQVATRRTVESDVWETFSGLRVAREGGGSQSAALEGGEAGGAGAGERGRSVNAAAARECHSAGEGAAVEEAGESGERFVVSGGHVREATALADLLQLAAPGDGRRFRLLGRAGDVIHVAGKRSSLGHLNYHLNSIEGVVDGAFWLPPDVADAVVRPVVFVVAPGLQAAHIAAELRARLDPVFVPRRLFKVAALPREATGKLGAQALERFAQAQGAGALR